MQNIKILIGSAGSYKAIVIAKFLSKHYPETCLLGFTTVRSLEIIHSRYFDEMICMPEVDETSFRNVMSDILVSRNIDLYIPVDSGEYRLIFDDSEMLKQEQLSYIGSKEAFYTLNDKYKLYSLCKKLGIQVPESSLNSLDSIRTGTVVKPLSSSSAKGVIYIIRNENVEIARKAVESYRDYIVQEYVDGVGVGYSVYAHEGEIIVGYGHRRISEYPTSGGSSNYRTGYENETLIDVSRKIISATNWSGFAMLEFKLTPAGKLVLIEVNPRVWGSINQGMQNGVNYFEHLLGKASRDVSGKGGINTYLAPSVFVSLAIYMMRLNYRPFFAFVKNAWRNKSDVSIVDDPKGVLSLYLRKLHFRLGAIGNLKL